MKVLFATNNPAKLSYYADTLKAHGFDLISLADLAEQLEIIEDGPDPAANAAKKAAVYAAATGLPTIAVDDGLILEGVRADEQPGTHVRRVGGKRLTDTAMIAHYSALAHKYGGKLNGYWLHGIAVSHGGQTKTFEQKSRRVFVDQPSQVVLEGYPLDSVSLVPEYNRYRSELTPEQVREEERERFRAAFDFITDELNKWRKDGSYHRTTENH